MDSLSVKHNPLFYFLYHENEKMRKYSLGFFNIFRSLFFIENVMGNFLSFYLTLFLPNTINKYEIYHRSLAL